MANELYENCPCGSGKKIKFCCPREFQAEFLKVLELLNSNQRAAAIERCDRALVKLPTQSCFLMVKIAGHLQMGDIEAAQQTWEKLNQTAPNNPVTKSFQVFFALDDEDLTNGVELLQDAVELANNESVPWLLRSAIERTMLEFVEQGQWFAFLQYGQHYDRTITKQSDQQILLTLKRACLDAEFPVVYKQPWLDRLIAEYPEPFKKVDLYQDLGLFRWRRLRDRFTQWRAQGQYEPAATAYLALTNALLLQHETAAALLREFAARDEVPEQLAAESLLLAYFLDPEQDPVPIVRKRVEYAVRDADALMERLLSHPLAQNVVADLRQFAPADEPPPKAAFDLLDRPQPAAGSLAVRDMPISLGAAFLFGRQTDREARLEVAYVDDGQGKNQQVIADLFGEFVEPDPKLIASDETSSLAVPGPQIVFPRTVDPPERRRITEEYLTFTITEYWPNRPHPFLGGKTPREATGDAALRKGLLAALLHLELTPPTDVWTGSYRDLWEQYGISYDLNSWSPRKPQLLALPRLNLKELDDLSVWGAAVYAAAMCVRRACNDLGREVLARPALRERDELGELLEMMAQASAPPEVKLQIAEGAIEWCERKNVSAGRFRIIQFVCYMILDQSEAASQTLRILTTRHTNEPETMQMLMATLQQIGVIGPDGRPVEAPPASAAAPQPAAASSGLWTPDQAATAPAEDKPGKLWLPGMD